MNARRFLEQLQEAVYAKQHHVDPAAIARLTPAILDALAPDLAKTDKKFSDLSRENSERLIAEAERSSRITPEQAQELRREIGDKLSRGFIDDIRDAEQTTYENPISAYFISNWRQNVEAGMKRIGLPSIPQLVVGTLPTERVNAMAIGIPFSEEHLVVLHSELIPFIGMLAKVISVVTPFTTQHDLRFVMASDGRHIQKHILQNLHAVNNFIRLVGAYVIRDRPSLATWLGPDPTSEQEIFAGALLDCTGTFVLAHEYAHVFSKHHTTSDRVRADIHGVDAEEILWQWRQEAEADSYAAMIMLYSQDSVALWLRFWGPMLFFTGADLIERARGILQTGEEVEPPSGPTHPPAAMRRQHMVELMNGFLDANLQSSGRAKETVIECAAALDEIMRILWSAARHSLLEKYAKTKG